MLVVPDRIYVGIRHDQLKDWRDKNSKHDLAFPTYKEDNAAFRKRQETVDSWTKRADICSFADLENKPMDGYRFVGYVSRLETSNKWMRVLHPRGWEFEISIKNALDILLKSTVTLGVINRQLVMGWDCGSLQLIIAGDEDYNHGREAFLLRGRRKENPKKLWESLKEGQYIETATVKGYYLGRHKFIGYEFKSKSSQYVLKTKTMNVIMNIHDKDHLGGDTRLICCGYIGLNKIVEKYIKTGIDLQKHRGFYYDGNFSPIATFEGKRPKLYFDSVEASWGELVETINKKRDWYSGEYTIAEKGLDKKLHLYTGKARYSFWGPSWENKNPNLRTGESYHTTTLIEIVDKAMTIKSSKFREHDFLYSLENANLVKVVIVAETKEGKKVYDNIPRVYTRDLY